MKQREKKIYIKKHRIVYLWDNFKWSNIRKTGVPEGGAENKIEKLMVDNFLNLNLMKAMNP